MKKDVLDAGFVRLVDQMGNDLSIVRNARVSYAAEWRAGKDQGSDERLIYYLMNNGHNSPFEAVTVSIEVKAPIFVLRQWQRHRTQSYNEVSARYTKLPREVYLPDLDVITTQHSHNKQMRTDEINPFANSIRAAIRTHNYKAFKIYESLLAKGCPRELARSVLPLGTYSHMFATANLHNWFKFVIERLDASAQFEIRVYAEAVLEILKVVAPVATKNAIKIYKLSENNEY